MKESFFRSFGFTLIEILVAVTLSSFVLIGLVSFIGSGLDTVQKTEQGLRNILQGTEIDEILVSLQNDRSKSVGVGLLPAFYSTGFIFETSSSSKKYVFVGVRSATGICASSPDTPYDVLQIAVSDRSRTPVEISTGPYRLDPVSGKIWSGATHIIGRGYPGSRIGDPLTTELESPSSLAIIGSHLYIADPGNSRILSYDTISQKITNWLDPENGLSDPEFLLAEGNSLLIGGTQWLLRVRPGVDTGSALDIWYISPVATSVKKILLRLDGVSSLVGGNLNTLSINGTSVLNPEDTLALGSTLEYTFSGTKTLGVGDPLSLTLSDILTPPTTPGSYLAYLEIQDELGGNTSWTGSYATIGSGDIQVSVGSIREMITLDPIRRLTSSSVYQTGWVDFSAFLTQSGGITSGILSPLENFTQQSDTNLHHIAFRKITRLDCQEAVHSTSYQSIKIPLSRP